MSSNWWWVKNVLIGVVAIAVFFFALETLIGTFQLKNPLEFIMYFFSTSLLLMVSLVGILYPVLQFYQRLKEKDRNGCRESLREVQK